MALWPLAFLVDAISFSSPCCPPLLPGYFAHIGGLVERDRAVLRSRRARLILDYCHSYYGLAADGGKRAETRSG